MRASLMILSLISALLVVQTYAETCEAKGKKSAVKKKKKKGKKAKAEGDVSDNPYADDEDAASVEEPAEAGAAEDVSETGEGETVEQPETESTDLVTQIKGDQGTVRRSNRMEFDERLVKGQAAKSGAVYLFKRVPRRLPGLVPMRRSYRRRIVEPVLGQRELKPAIYSEKPVLEDVAGPASEAPPGESPAETEPKPPKPEAEAPEEKKD